DGIDRPLTHPLTLPAPPEGAEGAREAWRWAARSVLRMSMVRVMGPTSPGTGVIARAFGLTEAKSTSPASLPVSSRLVPTSITTTPSLTMSPVTMRTPPAATQRMAPAGRGEVAGARVARRHGGVAADEELGEGLSHEARAPHHHRFRPLDRDPVVIEDLDATGRRARHQGRLAPEEIAEAHRVQAVGVL